MAIFSVNQARHTYVAVGNLVDSAAGVTKGSKGKLYVRPADATVDKGLYVLASTGKGDVVRSDIVYPGNVTSLSIRRAASMVPKARKYTVALSDDILVNIAGEGEEPSYVVPAGYSFILKIHYPTYQGMAEGESYSKLGDVYTRSQMAPEDFYEALAESIIRNTKNESKIWPIIDVDSDEDGLYLTEVAQDWHLGRMAQEVLHFNVIPVPVVIDGVAVDWVALEDDSSVGFEWITATDAITGETLTDGRYVADLEYFFMGERGDLYRGIGWPNNIETKYLVDPDKAYDVLDIDFFWAGDAEDVQKSPRVLTIIAESGKITDANAKSWAASLGLKTYFKNGVPTTTAS